MSYPNMRSTAFIVCLAMVVVFVSSTGKAQTVRSYAEAEKQGAAMLKELQRENKAVAMRYKELKHCSSFKKQVRDPFTIYEIKDVFDLKGETVTIPDHCILLFNGGSLKNGRVAGNDIKYCYKEASQNGLNCEIDGTAERVGYPVKASSVGMVKNDAKRADANYKQLKSILDRGQDLYLDGSYYVTFSDPLVLDRVFRIYGGELIYRKNAFRFSDGGGLVVEGSTITASEKSRSSFFCGSSELLGALTVQDLSFLYSTIDCGYLANVLFQDLNSDEVSFGVNRIEVDHCVFKETGRIRVMDAVIRGNCSFLHNDYQRFTTTPIYICCQHSLQASPNDKSAYRYVANNLTKGCPMVIDHNIFKGTSVDLDFYYCSALVKAVDCQFTNNYLQDIVNYSDGSNATAYDAYLSCVNVVYENNFVKDMMSFSKDGRSKPQCQIGKSKTNPLSYLDYPARRIYRNNVFLVNGERFLKDGADASSLYADIFGNKSYMDEYVWEGNAVVFKKANLKTGVAAKSYGFFRMTDNYFEVDEMSGGGLVTVRSDEPVNQVLIKGNTFKLGKSQLLPLFNQKYKEDYRRENQKRIEITDNTFINASPKVFYFTGENIVIKNNDIGKGDIIGNLYLSKSSGSGTVLDVKQMDTELQYRKNDKNTGGLMQYFSSESKGTYALDLDQVPEKGVSYTYKLGDDHAFCISLTITKGAATQEIRIPFQVQKGSLSYQWEGKTVKVASGNSDSKVWYKGDGIQLKTTFFAGEKKQVVTHLTAHGTSPSGSVRYKLSYISE